MLGCCGRFLQTCLACRCERGISGGEERLRHLVLSLGRQMLGKRGSTPTPWARGLRDQIQFSVRRGGLRLWSQTMVSEGARPWGWGRSGDCDMLLEWGKQPPLFVGPFSHSSAISPHFSTGRPEPYFEKGPLCPYFGQLASALC